QRRPGPLHVLGVELADQAPQPVADGVLREVVDPSRGDVPAGVTPEGVTEDQDRVDGEDDAADADAEVTVEVEPDHGVPGEDPAEDEREVPRVTMNVLHDERKARLARVLTMRLCNGTRW